MKWLLDYGAIVIPILIGLIFAGIRIGVDYTKDKKRKRNQSHQDIVNELQGRK